jgi:8-oxo-dGTP pyrophosphatase MutT (NUDIX family)
MSSDLHQIKHAFPRSVANDLAERLPGESAQDTMAPKPRSYAEHTVQPVAHAKVNGVLILFYLRDGEIYLPLILRPIYPGVHSGQISLPGGRVEDEDTDVVACALREANEEIGIDRSQVRVLGQLSPLYIGASNNTVYPVVGWSCELPTFETDEREVAQLIEVPLRSLQDPDNVHQEQRNLRGRSALVPYFQVCDQIIWGATAMILGELLALPSLRELREH